MNTTEMPDPEFRSTQSSSERRFRFIAWIVLVAGVVLLWPCAIGISHLRIKNDLEHWLPESDPGLKQLKWYYSHFPPEDRVLLTWRGSTLDDPRIEAITKKLLTGNPYISAVINPRDMIGWMVDRNIPEEVAIQRLSGMLIGRSENNPPVSMLLTLTPKGSQQADLAIASIRQAAAEVDIPDSALALGGSAVARSQLDRQVGHAAWNPDVPAWWLPERSPLLMSVIVGLCLCVSSSGGVWLATAVVAASLYGVALSLGVMGLTGGHIDLVGMVMPALLFVLALSGAIHLINYWRPSADISRSIAVKKALSQAWIPCVLASVTTAIGLWSLSSSPLIPVRTFGIYSGIGCLCILIAALLVLPALLYVGKIGRADRVRTDGTRWSKLGGWLVQHANVVSGASLVVMVLAAVGLYRLKTETKIIRYFPDTSRIIQDYTFLERELSGIVPMEVVVRFQSQPHRNSHFADRMERVSEVQRLIQTHPDVSGSLSLADFRPNVDRPGKNAPTLQKIRYLKTADEFRRRLERGEFPESKSFFQVVDVDDEFSSAGDELWRITAQVNVLSDLDYATFLRQISAEAATALEGAEGASAVVTGHVPLFLRTQQAVLQSLIVSFLLTTAIISIILLLLLRNFSGALAATLPNIFPIAIVFGVFSWFGGVIDLGTMMTASIGLGIAVDGTLHMLSWFESGIRKGKNPPQAAADALGHCGEALWQTGLMTAAGLAMLGFADLLLVSRFGWMMASLLIAACFGDIVLLTTLLAGPLGRRLAARVKRTATTDLASRILDAEADAEQAEPLISSPDGERNRAGSRSHVAMKM